MKATGLDTLLDLDGQVFVVDPSGAYWVKFSVRRVAISPEYSHGLSYSMTLHDSDGNRLVGFDNAHPVRESRGPGGKGKRAHDHKHRLGTVSMVCSKRKEFSDESFESRNCLL